MSVVFLNALIINSIQQKHPHGTLDVHSAVFYKHIYVTHIEHI